MAKRGRRGRGKKKQPSGAPGAAPHVAHAAKKVRLKRDKVHERLFGKRNLDDLEALIELDDIVDLDDLVLTGEMTSEQTEHWSLVLPDFLEAKREVSSIAERVAHTLLDGRLSEEVYQKSFSTRNEHIGVIPEGVDMRVSRQLSFAGRQGVSRFYSTLSSMVNKLRIDGHDARNNLLNHFRTEVYNYITDILIRDAEERDRDGKVHIERDVYYTHREILMGCFETLSRQRSEGTNAKSYLQTFYATQKRVHIHQDALAELEEALPAPEGDPEHILSQIRSLNAFRKLEHFKREIGPCTIEVYAEDIECFSDGLKLSVICYVNVQFHSEQDYIPPIIRLDSHGNQQIVLEFFQNTGGIELHIDRTHGELYVALNNIKLGDMTNPELHEKLRLYILTAILEYLEEKEDDIEVPVPSAQVVFAASEDTREEVGDVITDEPKNDEPDYKEAEEAVLEANKLALGFDASDSEEWKKRLAPMDDAAPKTEEVESPPAKKTEKKIIPLSAVTRFHDRTKIFNALKRICPRHRNSKNGSHHFFYPPNKDAQMILLPIKDKPLPPEYMRDVLIILDMTPSEFAKHY